MRGICGEISLQCRCITTKIKLFISTYCVVTKKPWFSLRVLHWLCVYVKNYCILMHQWSLHHFQWLLREIVTILCECFHKHPCFSQTSSHFLLCWFFFHLKVCCKQLEGTTNSFFLFLWMVIIWQDNHIKFVFDGYSFLRMGFVCHWHCMPFLFILQVRRSWNFLVTNEINLRLI